VRLIDSGFLLLIDGRQPICFLKDCLNQSSIPLGLQISAATNYTETDSDYVVQAEKSQNIIAFISLLVNGKGDAIHVQRVNFL